MGDVPIFRICVFSPFLKQQKLGGQRGVWLLPADPHPQRQAGRAAGLVLLPHVGWLPPFSGSQGTGRSVRVTEAPIGSHHIRVEQGSEVAQGVRICNPR